jgi:DNA-binding Xre family transcriptional regulator
MRYDSLQAMPVINHFRRLLIAKAQKDGRRMIPLSEIEREVKITWRTLQAWDSNAINRFDGVTIEALCQYFSCTVGELLEHVSNPPLSSVAVGENGAPKETPL